MTHRSAIVMVASAGLALVLTGGCSSNDMPAADSSSPAAPVVLGAGDYVGNSVHRAQSSKTAANQERPNLAAVFSQ